MNFQQLRIVREAVRQGFNLTDVGKTLFTSQSGVSKNIKELEDELGVQLFVRRGKRLTGMTDAGEALLGVVERILLDSRNLQQIAAQFSNPAFGNLRLATTHTQARYALPETIKGFTVDFPGVHLELHQGSPREIADLLVQGEVDIGIATEVLDDVPELITFPWYAWQHGLVVQHDHPLAKSQHLTLKDIAAFPLITYHSGFTGRSHIDQAFQNAGLEPDIVLTAIDADVIKTYVEIGLGIGILATMAFNPERDTDLVMLPVGHLFGDNMTRIAIHRGHYLRPFAYRFIERLAPHLTEDEIQKRLLELPAIEV